MFDLNSLGYMEAAAALLSRGLPYHWNGVFWCRPQSVIEGRGGTRWGGIGSAQLVELSMRDGIRWHLWADNDNRRGSSVLISVSSVLRVGSQAGAASRGGATKIGRGRGRICVRK